MNEGTREAFQIGQRCKVGEYFATVRYIGPVPPSQGVYLIVLNNLNNYLNRYRTVYLCDC